MKCATDWGTNAESFNLDAYVGLENKIKLWDCIINLKQCYIEELLLYSYALGDKMSKREFNTGPPIPEEMLSTYDMLGKAFPHGIPCKQYYIVLKLLYNGMSDRQLAEAMAHFTQKDMLSIYCKDIPKVYYMEFTQDPLFINTKRLLIECGYLQWLDED